MTNDKNGRTCLQNQQSYIIKGGAEIANKTVVRSINRLKHKYNFGFMIRYNNLEILCINVALKHIHYKFNNKNERHVWV